MPTLPVIAQENRVRAFPLAKINTVVPQSFPEHSETARLSPKWRTYSRAEILTLRDAGLVICVDAVRKLWKWTHRANMRTHKAIEHIGGLVSLSIGQRLHQAIAQELNIKRRMAYGVDNG